MKRLDTVFSLITPCECLVDIGTDHGLIAQKAANIAKRVIASDISEKCLQKARDSIKNDNVDFRVGDGLSVLDCDPDIITICGMGGHTIIDILSNYKGNAALILQPQNDAYALRQFLFLNGYNITHDIPASEKGKYYDIIKAKKAKGRIRPLTELMLLFGKFYKNKNIILNSRLLKLKQNVSTYKKTDQNQKLLKQIDKALVFQN